MLPETVKNGESAFFTIIERRTGPLLQNQSEGDGEGPGHERIPYFPGMTTLF